MQSLASRHVSRSDGREELYISVDTLVWVGVVAAGVAIRLVGLGDAEFTVEESGRAIDALSVARGDVPETWAGDMAGAAASFLFEAFDESELLARLPSAIGGSLLVIALWLMRPFAGRACALAAGTLVAFSSLFVFFSRSAEPYAIGAAFAVLAAGSLLAYLREPGPVSLFSFALFAGLATVTDAVGVAGLLAIVVFVGFEALVVGNADVRRAWSSFRSSPLQWVVVVLVIAGTLQLGLTHFGTSTDKIGLAGMTQFAEMFEAPRDSRPANYHAALLVAYDWPIIAAGIGGLVVVGWRILRSGLGAVSPFDRLALVWTAVGAIVLASVTQREGGQTLILLLPLALLGGSLAETASRNASWTALQRWWPAAAGLILLVVSVALLLTEWSSGNATRFEQVLMYGSAGGAALLGAVMLLLDRPDGAVAVVAAVAVVGGAYAAHSSLAVAFEEGAELARDETLLERREQFRQVLDQLVTERDGLVVIDPELQDVLGWTLRDSPYVFGDDPEEATVYVGRPDESPDAFRTVGDPWLVSEEWYPHDVLEPRSSWRWLLYREPFGPVETTSVQIYVPTI